MDRMARWMSCAAVAIGAVLWAAFRVWSVRRKYAKADMPDSEWRRERWKKIGVK